MSNEHKFPACAASRNISKHVKQRDMYFQLLPDIYIKMALATAKISRIAGNFIFILYTTIIEERIRFIFAISDDDNIYFRCRLVNNEHSCFILF